MPQLAPKVIHNQRSLKGSFIFTLLSSADVCPVAYWRRLSNQLRGRVVQGYSGPLGIVPGILHVMIPRNRTAEALQIRSELEHAQARTRVQQIEKPGGSRTTERAVCRAAIPRQRRIRKGRS
jgi:hypothetical protein